MSDEERREDAPEPEYEVPDWLTDESLADEETAMLAAEEGRGAAGDRRVVKAVPRRRYIYRSSEWIRASPKTFRCRVTVYSAAGEFTGEHEGPQVPGVRAEIAARATLDALNAAERDHVALALKGARVLRVFEAPIVVVGVYGLNSSVTTPLVGACLVRNSTEQASILATLQAADRWLAWQARDR